VGGGWLVYLQGFAMQYMYGDTGQIFGITYESKEWAPVRLIKNKVFLYMERIAQFRNQQWKQPAAF